MKNFIWNVKEFGLKLAMDNVAISFCKWFVGARRITLVYKKNGRM